MMSVSVQWDREATQEDVCAPGPGRGLRLLPAPLQLPDPSGSPLPAVQSVRGSDSHPTGAGLDLLHASFPGSCLNEKLRFWVLQVRVALKDWDHIQRFEKDALDARHLDVVYILRQLMMQKALLFVSMPTLVAAGVERRPVGPVPAALTAAPLSSALLQQEEKGAEVPAV